MRKPHLSILLVILTFVSEYGFAQTYPGNLFNNSNDTLIMWLKADFGVLNSGNNAVNGDEVNTWTDLSGARTNNATDNNEISSPTYLNDSTHHLNYNPCLSFDGIGDGINFGSDYIFPDGGLVEVPLVGSALGFETFEGLSFFTVQKPISSDNTKTLQFIYDIGNYDLNGFGSVYTSNSTMLYTPKGTVGTLLSGTIPTVLDILLWLLGSSTVSNSNSSGFVNHNHDFETTISRTSVVSGSNLLGVLLGGASKSSFINCENVYSVSNFDLLQLNLNAILGGSQHYSASGPFTIGRQAKSDNYPSNSTRAFEGNIAEVIAYSGVLSNAETNRIESYLAIKYGITLAYGGTENGNYTASDGTTVWSANSAGTTFHNNIIGIARDDNSGLLQKQSHTQDDSLRVYLDELDTINSGNQGTFSNDLSFLIIGDNTDNLYSSSSYSEKPAGFYSRLDREWRIQTTNFTDTFSIDITLNEFATNKDVDTSDLYFLVDNDGDFSSGANSFNSMDGITFTLNGNVLSVTGLNPSIIPNNSSNFFTIGSGSGNTPLPVDLTEFTSSINSNNEVHINWTSSTEINNDYYSLYHSIDTEHWALIKKISAAGNSQTQINYSYTHSEAKSGYNYYKLQQTDFDGSPRNLGILCEKIEPPFSQINAYPNPVKGGLHVKGNLDLSAGIFVINHLGIATEITDYTLVSEDHIILNVAYLNKGSYYLKMNKQAIRFTKL